MRKFHAAIIIACATLGATTVYAQQSTVSPQADTTAKPQGLAEMSEVEAVQLMAQGDNWTGTNVLKARLSKNDTPLNRFNLATGYQRTGRLDQAQALYQDLLDKGRTTTVIATPTSASQGVRMFNLADESASRLLYIDWLKSEQASKVVARRGDQAPVAAEALGVEASAVEGGPARGEVSDAQAQALDMAAHQGAAP